MNCQQSKPLIQLYADGELDATRIPELELHFRDCPACARVWNNLRSLKKGIKQDALFLRAPTELRRSIQAELRSRAGGTSERKFWHFNWLTATTGALAICLAVLLALDIGRPSSEQRLARELVSSHVRSLMANHALDVASSDQHAVKPWFNGKLDFSPPVKDPAPQEFPLLGGRLDYIGGRAVAALVFQRHKHVINLFIWPAAESEMGPRALAPMKGYHLIHWAQSEINFWVVSDLNAPELDAFVQSFRTN